MQKQKSTFLLIASVLAVIFCVAGLAADIALLCTVDRAPFFSLSFAGTAFNYSVDRLGSSAVIISMFTMACGITAGVFGFLNYNKPEKMTACLSWCVTWMVMCVFSCYTIIGVMVNDINVVTFLALGVSVFIGIVIPALYLAAVGSFKKRAQASSEKAAA